MSEISINFLAIGYLSNCRGPNMNLMKKLIIQKNARVAHIPLLKQKYLKYFSIFDNWDRLLSLLILMVIMLSPVVYLLEEKLNKGHGDEICDHPGKRGPRSFS